MEDIHRRNWAEVRSGILFEFLEDNHVLRIVFLHRLGAQNRRELAATDTLHQQVYLVHRIDFAVQPNLVAVFLQHLIGQKIRLSDGHRQRGIVQVIGINRTLQEHRNHSRETNHIRLLGYLVRHHRVVRSAPAQHAGDRQIFVVIRMRLNKLLCGHCAVTALRVTEEIHFIGLKGVTVGLKERSCQSSEIGNGTSRGLFVQIWMYHLIGDTEAYIVGINNGVAFGG